MLETILAGLLEWNIHQTKIEPKEEYAQLTDYILPSDYPSVKRSFVLGDSVAQTQEKEKILADERARNASYQRGGGDIEAKIRAAFPEEPEVAVAVSKAESSLRVDAHNYNPKTKDDSYGLFQINLWGANKNTRPSPEILLTIDGNIQFARQLYESSGWNPWTTFRNGQYKQYLLL